MITVKVSEELRKRMKEFRYINWSEVIRQAIEKIIAEEERKSVARALLLNEKYVIVPDEGFSSTKLIRNWREGVRWLEQ